MAYRIIRDLGREIGHDTLVVAENGSGMYFTHLSFILHGRPFCIPNLKAAKIVAEVLGDCAVEENGTIVFTIGSWSKRYLPLLKMERVSGQR